MPSQLRPTSSGRSRACWVTWRTGTTGCSSSLTRSIVASPGSRRTPNEALALGADAVSIGTAALIALNWNAPLFEDDYAALGVKPGFCHHCHTGRCPVGITTQDPELIERLEVDGAADRVFNFLQSMTMEMQMFARACGKSSVHDLEPEDMRALTLEASLITGIPVAGTGFTLRPEDIAAAVAAWLAGGNGHAGH
jgi:hypothetical protein